MTTETKIAGIMRAEAYSPNHVGDDAAIFNTVCDNLRQQGCNVEVYSEEQFLHSGAKPEIVVGMYRLSPTIRHLQKLEDAGSLVINSAYGVENCTRERMTRILLDSGVPYPESLIVNTDESVCKVLERARFEACWIKRADSHTLHKDDVGFCRNIMEAEQRLQKFSDRGINRVVINRHIEGKWIKFYGVAGTPFFHWFLPTDHKSLHESSVKAIDSQLREIGEVSARELGIMVYGGDCILAADGTLIVIDFNDWPSFAPCRDEAAFHIARAILATIQKNSEC